MQVKGGMNNLLFFNWLSNVKFWFFQMALKTYELRSSGIKIAFFSKKLQKLSPPIDPSGSTPTPPSVRRLSYVSLLNSSPALDIFAFQLLVQVLIF